MKADQLASQINNTDECRQMFEAVRTLAKVDKQNVITVHDADGCNIENDVDKAEQVKTWFQNQFSGRDETLSPFDGNPRPLNNPILVSEVESAAKRLKNGSACGPDNTPNALFKVATPDLFNIYAKIINSCFKQNVHLDCIGESNITLFKSPTNLKVP